MIHSNKISSIAVFAVDAAHYDAALSLAKKLSIPLVQNKTDEFQFLLICSDDGLALKQTGKNGPGAITVNFLSGASQYRLKHGGGRKQALARAVGLKKGIQPTVIDATAGLGRDGFILAHLGCHVHMIERSPILAALLEDGLQRAKQAKQTADIIKSRLQFTQTDSKNFFKKLQQEDYPDVIYLDPMYPERTKSSLVKKEMRILRGLAGNDQDAEDLFKIALGCARNRVVVKRPRLAPTISNMPPSHQIKGKTSRFDVYLV